MKRLGIALFLLLGLGVAAFFLWPGAPTYARKGPYRVGVRDFSIKTSLESRPLPATLWYPALSATGRKGDSTFTMENAPFGGTNRTVSGKALPDAAPDFQGAPYPLVIFSHGSPGTRVDAVPRMEHWASHGFAVLAMDHGKYERYRSSDLRDALDFAEQLTTNPGPFVRFMDTQRTAMAGFSFGGLSVLYMGGAHVAGLSDEPRDPRLKALVLLAPEHDQVQADTLDFRPADLPALVMVGSEDRRFQEVEKIYRALPGPRKLLVTLLGSRHEVFLDPSFKKTFWSDLDPGTLDANQAQNLIQHFTTAFLLDVLRNDPKARKALLPGAVTFKEITYDATPH